MNNLSDQIEKLAKEYVANKPEQCKPFIADLIMAHEAGAKAMLELLEPTLKEVRGGLKGIHGCKRCIICGDYSYGALKKLDKILSSSES